jgi:fumarate hydratase, class II
MPSENPQHRAPSGDAASGRKYLKPSDGNVDDRNADDVELSSESSFPASDSPPWTLGVKHTTYRTEHDSLGDVLVPEHSLYGAQTQRAVENFRISKYRFQPEFIKALGLIKACAAKANAALGVMPLDTATAIEKAANEIAAGAHYGEFVVDVFQTGSGTSTNMNANEVIARLSSADSSSGVHPNDHVNRSQSSNDVIPSAIHIAAAICVRGELLPSMELLRGALEEKSHEFWDVMKIGRTHLQDATPIRLGQEFSGYAHQLKASEERLKTALEGMYELPLGGTAVGTGINAPPEFGAKAIGLLAERTGLPFREARNHFEAQAAKDAVLFLSGALKTYAVSLTKIANDIRWLGSGPRAGLGELLLPELQPGSSIMPGKVNPVIPESVLMICAHVIGNDAAITWGAASGNFELNTMMPLLGYQILDSIELLAAGTRNFTTRCVAGLRANREKTGELMERSLALATPLATAIGYDKAAQIAKEAQMSGKTIRDIAIEKSGLTEKEIDLLLAGAMRG